MKPGYIYIENGTPVWNAKMKPTFLDFPEIFFDNMSRYEPALKQWQETCVVIDNAKKMQSEIGAISTDGYECIEKSEVMWFVVINEKWEYISPGQKAYIDGRIIVKLG